MKVTSQRKKTLDPRTGASQVIEDKSMEPNVRTEVKNNNLTRPERDAYMEKLEKDVIDAQYDISEFLKEHYEWSSNPHVLRTQSDVANYMFCQKLHAASLEPLSRGIDSRSIAESIGMSIGMRMASKQYNSFVKTEKAKKKLGKMQNGLHGKIRNAAADFNDRTMDTMNSFTDALNIENPKTVMKAMEKYSSWLRGEGYVKQANGGIMPITEESAAITYLGLAKKTYQDMREPGADVDAVYNKFIQARQCLYEQARYDGIHKDAIHQNVREIVGKMAEKYPDMTIFEEVSKGETELKNGKFINKETGKEYTGEFGPRKPKTKEQYEERLKQEFSDMYADCKSMQDINNIDFKTSGFADKMDTMRQQYCSDLGQNKENIDNVNIEFNDLYTSVAMDQLDKWAEKDPNRKKEMDAFFKQMQQQQTQEQTQQQEQPNQKTARDMITPELLEVAGMDNYGDNGYGIER